MKKWQIIIPAAAVLLFAGQAAAQSEEEEARARYEESRSMAEVERTRAVEAREAAMEDKLRAAEARMEAAAREIAEITKERLPRIVEIEQRYAMSNKPRLGVTIETTDDGPVEGVKILGVSPASAAADAGLRSGDIMTSVNDETLSAESCDAANKILLDFMQGVEPGDVLTVEYLRDGKVGSVEVEPRIMADNTFFWRSEDGPRRFTMPAVPVAPEALKEFNVQFGFPWVHSGLGDLELVELNEGLGKYFGTDEGLLVVNAPKSDDIDIRDGDVIQSIDGRAPKDTRHAMKILSSYQAGEKLKLGIMRDKRRMTIDVEIPSDHHGNRSDGFEFEIRPAAAPQAAPAVAPADEITS